MKTKKVIRGRHFKRNVSKRHFQLSDKPNIQLKQSAPGKTRKKWGSVENLYQLKKKKKD